MLLDVGEGVFTRQLVWRELSGSDTPQHSSSVLERLMNVLLVRFNLLQERDILIGLGELVKIWDILGVNRIF